MVNREDQDNLALIVSDKTATPEAQSEAGGELYNSTKSLASSYVSKYGGIIQPDEIWDTFTDVFLKSSREWTGQDDAGFYMFLSRRFTSRLRDIADTLLRKYGLGEYTKEQKPSTITRHEGLQMLRQAIRDSVPLAEQISPSAEDDYDAAVNSDAVNAIVALLPRKDRLVLSYAYGIEGKEGDPYVENLTKQEFVVGVLGYSVDSVRNLERWTEKAILAMRTKLLEFQLTGQDFGFYNED